MRIHHMKAIWHKIKALFTRKPAPVEKPRSPRELRQTVRQMWIAEKLPPSPVIFVSRPMLARLLCSQPGAFDTRQPCGTYEGYLIDFGVACIPTYADKSVFDFSIHDMSELQNRIDRAYERAQAHRMRVEQGMSNV